jgi:hypothetical protein
MEPLITEKQLKQEILKISNVTFWSWRKQGRLDDLHPIQIGRCRYYMAQDVNAFFQKLADSR